MVSSLSFSPKADQSLKKRHRIDIKLVFFLQSHHPNCKSIDAWQKLPHAKDESFHLSGLSASILTKDGDLAGPHTIDLEVSVGSGEYPLTKQIVYEI